MITELKRKMNGMLRRKEMMAQQDPVFKRIGSGAHPLTPDDDDDDDVRYVSLCVDKRKNSQFINTSETCGFHAENKQSAD